MKWITTYEAANNQGFKRVSGFQAHEIEEKYSQSIFTPDELKKIHLLKIKFMNRMMHQLNGKKLDISYYKKTDSNNYQEITDKKLIQSETISILIEMDGDTYLFGHPVFDIYKREDDWFTLHYFNKSMNFTGKRSGETLEWYICDEIDGLINLLKQKLQMK